MLNPLPNTGVWCVSEQVPTLAVRLARRAKAAAIVIVAVRHLQVHRDLIVLQVEVADNDLLDSRPLSLDFITKVGRCAPLCLIIGRRFPRGNGSEIHCGGASLRQVAPVSIEECKFAADSRGRV